MQLCSLIAPQLSKALTITWPRLFPHSACQLLITTQPGCCCSLPSSLPALGFLPTSLPPFLTPLGPITPSMKYRQCIVGPIKSKLPRSTYKAPIVSPHPIYSVCFPRKASPFPLNQEAVIFTTEAATHVPLQLSFPTSEDLSSKVSSGKLHFTHHKGTQLKSKLYLKTKQNKKPSCTSSTCTDPVFLIMCTNK